MTAQTPKKERFIPPWVWPASSIVLLLVGGTFLYWYANHEVDVPSGPLTHDEIQLAEFGAVHVPFATVPNVGRIVGGRGQAKLIAGDFRVDITARALPPYSYNYTADRHAVYTAADLKIIEFVHRVLYTPGLDPKLVPPDFVHQLHDKFGNQITDINIHVADDDQKSIESLFSQYLSAQDTDRPAIAAQLLHTVQSASVAAIQRQADAFAATAQSARAMIPPDKIQDCRTALREAAHPDTRPTTRLVSPHTT